MENVITRAFIDEITKIASANPGVLSRAMGKLRSAGSSIGKGLHKYEDHIEVGGLGVLAAPGIDSMVARHRANKAGLADAHGHISEENIDKFRLIKEKYHAPVDVGGLGVLAAPSLAKIVGGHK
jgi:glucan phosphorylase